MYVEYIVLCRVQSFALKQLGCRLNRLVSGFPNVYVRIYMPCLDNIRMNATTFTSLLDTPETKRFLRLSTNRHAFPGLFSHGTGGSRYMRGAGSCDCFVAFMWMFPC